MEQSLAEQEPEHRLSLRREQALATSSEMESLTGLIQCAFQPGMGKLVGAAGQAAQGFFLELPSAMR